MNTEARRATCSPSKSALRDQPVKGCDFLLGMYVKADMIRENEERLCTINTRVTLFKEVKSKNHAQQSPYYATVYHSDIF